MAWRQFKAHITVLVMASVALRHLTSQQCGTDLRSIYQMMLQGHTFKTLKTQPGTLECRQACLADIRCQSYNVVFKGICELNNRTKEARPDDFVKDLERYYVKSSTRGKKLIKSKLFMRNEFLPQSTSSVDYAKPVIRMISMMSSP